MRLAILAVAGLLYAPGPTVADDLRPFLRGSWSEILKSHAGRPTIVHFWGMTCGPCRVEMPTWGTFAATHPSVDLVTIDTDAITTHGAAEAFLKSANVPTTHAWRFADSYVEKLYFSIDPNWQGEIPMTMLIGRHGTVTTISGAVAMTDVEKWFDHQR